MPHEQPHLDRDYALESRVERIKKMAREFKTRRIVNSFLQKQAVCSTQICMNCVEICEECKRWEANCD